MPHAGMSPKSTYNFDHMVKERNKTLKNLDHKIRAKYDHLESLKSRIENYRPQKKEREPFNALNDNISNSTPYRHKDSFSDTKPPRSYHYDSNDNDIISEDDVPAGVTPSHYPETDNSITVMRDCENDDNYWAKQ